jgi:hypothetical protein
LSCTLLLARTLFARFFESELLPPGLPQAQLIIWSMAFLAAPGLLLPVRLSGVYPQLQHDPARLASVIHGHRLIFIMMSMTCMGLVALVLWQNVYPDRRDARLLGALPLSSRVLVAGRLLALSMLAGVFLLGVNAVPTVLYGLLAGYYGAANVLLGVAAHAVAAGGAGAFVFFLLIAIQGIWLNLGRQSAERLAFAMQLVFLMALLAHAGMLGPLTRLAGPDLQRIGGDPLWRAIPASWFLGLYDVVSGRPGPGSATLAAQALIATLGAAAMAAGLLAVTHRRLTRLAIEGRNAPRRGGRVRSRLDWLAAVVCRSAAERAVFQFTIRTLARSRSHRMLLGLYLGLAIALIGLTLGPTLVRYGAIALTQPAIGTLAAPLVLMFFLLTGANVMLAIPVEPKANWVFRLLEPASRVAAIDGARDALLAMIAAPIALAAGAVAAWLWGAWIGLVHGAFCLAMGWALVEVLLLRVRKIPFTCIWFAGRSRARLWPFYLLACSTYCFTSAAIELAVLNRPRGLVLVFAALASIIAGLSLVRARLLTAPPGLRFEEEDPEAIFEGFRLSEGLAARAPRGSKTTPEPL